MKKRKVQEKLDDEDNKGEEKGFGARVTQPNHNILHVLRNNRDLQGALNGEM